MKNGEWQPLITRMTRIRGIQIVRIADPPEANKPTATNMDQAVTQPPGGLQPPGG